MQRRKSRRRGVGECGSDSVRDLKLQVEQKRNVQRHAQVEVLCSRGSGLHASDDLILDLTFDSPARHEEHRTGGVSVTPEACKWGSLDRSGSADARGPRRPPDALLAGRRSHSLELLSHAWP